MPDETLAIDDQVENVLEQVRRQEGLETRDQAAEFLVRRRLRKGTASLTGRGRALYDATAGGNRR
ncbi:hypothetical protein KZO85_00180 [Chromohalobacter canadensis]|uniref:hypothetical protein n=1 Tax=Chromohalobacter canadensis TaxID=141389 RepID=UPI0021BF00F4|nr:hypothetical protein [Chromohalobacter canadensis]MCT8466993.1 hypothetical protein [Chromohalobacter canadensis]